MGLTKTELFSPQQNEMATMAKAFAHPARVAILEYLLKANACINSHLVQELGLAQATISQHLRELKDLEIIQGTIEGACMSYCINPQRWQELQQRFGEFFGTYAAPNQKDCC